jgi:hypothetical protein
MIRTILIDSIGGNSESVREVGVVGTLKAVHYKNPPCVLAIDMGGGKTACAVSEEISPTLACTHGGGAGNTER